MAIHVQMILSMFLKRCFFKFSGLWIFTDGYYVITHWRSIIDKVYRVFKVGSVVFGVCIFAIFIRYTFNLSEGLEGAEERMNKRVQEYHKLALENAGFKKANEQANEEKIQLFKEKENAQQRINEFLDRNRKMAMENEGLKKDLEKERIAKEENNKLATLNKQQMENNKDQLQKCSDEKQRKAEQHRIEKHLLERDINDQRRQINNLQDQAGRDRNEKDRQREIAENAERVKLIVMTACDCAWCWLLLLLLLISLCCNCFQCCRRNNETYYTCSSCRNSYSYRY